MGQGRSKEIIIAVSENLIQILTDDIKVCGVSIKIFTPLDGLVGPLGVTQLELGDICGRYQNLENL